MKKLGIGILICIVVYFTLNMGPVWLQRVIGFTGYSNKAYYPRWINNEEYCYIRVENFFDYGLGFSGVSKDFFHPLKFFRTPNATFYVYKVNINELNNKKLIRKITQKVDFVIPPEELKLSKRGNFIFRYLDNGELVLIIKGYLKYAAYYMDTNGKVLRKQSLGYSNPLFGDQIIVDMSVDGKKILVYEYGKEGYFIKDITSEQKISFSEWANEVYCGARKWIAKDKIIIYNIFSLDKIDYLKNMQCDICLVNGKRENTNWIYSNVFTRMENIDFAELDAAISKDENFLFLSNSAILKKQNEEWQTIKDIRSMAFGFHYPDISPNSKRIIGIKNEEKAAYYDYNKHSFETTKAPIDFENEKQITVLETEDLLK